MNKTQLIDVVATKTGLKKKDADAAVAAIFEAIEEALVAGEKVQVIGFGSFEVKERAARTGRNPATGSRNQDSCIQVSLLLCRQGPERKGKWLIFMLCDSSDLHRSCFSYLERTYLYGNR